MKTIIVFVALLAVCLCRPPKPKTQNPQEATILQFDSNNVGVGPYSFSYQTSDGSSRQEVGELKNPGTDEEAMVVRGSYTYIGSDGVQYTVTYTADENGFHPEGQHLPGRRSN